MELEDFLDAEVGIAAGVTAALFSPRVRKVLRRGAVLGVAGALMAGDAIAGFSRGWARGGQQATGPSAGATSTPSNIPQSQQEEHPVGEAAQTTARKTARRKSQ